MTGKTTNEFSPDVRERAVRRVPDHVHEYPSRRRAILSISAKIDCSGHALNDWVRKACTNDGPLIAAAWRTMATADRNT